MTLITTAWGMPEEEQFRIAQKTCLEIRKTEPSESWERLHLMDEARQQIGAGPYLGGEETLMIAFRLGLCEALVMSVEVYESLALEEFDLKNKQRTINECLHSLGHAKMSLAEHYHVFGAFPQGFQPDRDQTSQVCMGFVNISTDGETYFSFEIDMDEAAIGYADGIIQPQMTAIVLPSGIINYNCGRGSTSEAGLEWLPKSCQR